MKSKSNKRSQPALDVLSATRFAQLIYYLNSYFGFVKVIIQKKPAPMICKTVLSVVVALMCVQVIFRWLNIFNMAKPWSRKS